MKQVQQLDHKKIGQIQELFFTDDVAPGAPFWLPKGMIIFKELEKYIRELTEKAGYLETSTPIMVKNDLFKQSGHWTKFGAHNMYNLSIWEDDEIEEAKEQINQNRDKIKNLISDETPRQFPFKINIKKQSVAAEIIITDTVKKEFMWNLPMNYSFKPMNCPESTVLYNFRTRSYKELPLRFSEIGRLHRREKSGEVNGLLRVRQITMDDAHIYVTEEQIFEEVSKIMDMMIAFYKSFGFEYEFRLATRPETRAGIDANWSRAEKDLEEALKKKKLSYGDKKGDGAFYGPKIDVHIKDSQDREWQLATVQLDFHQPEAFKLVYIDKDGKEKRPVMIHRAIFGSFERFIAILTEHYQGKFPLWLSPVQVKVIPISERHNEAAKKVTEMLAAEGIRVELDNRQERMQAKLRDATLQKIPFMAIIGDKEMEAGEPAVSIRTRDGENTGQIAVSEFLKQLKQDIETKR